MEDKLAEAQIIEMLANLDIKDAKLNPQGHLVFTWKNKMCKIEENPKFGIVLVRPVNVRQRFRTPDEYLKFVQDVGSNYACDPSYDEMFNEFVQYTLNMGTGGGMTKVVLWHEYQPTSGPETLKGILDKLLVLAEYVEKVDKRLAM
jgi:hypothetical protein